MPSRALVLRYGLASDLASPIWKPPPQERITITVASETTELTGTIGVSVAWRRCGSKPARAG